MIVANSYRAILRSSAIMGSASAINIALGLVRIKVVAVLLGPVGVGLLGLYNSLTQTASNVAALGIGKVGTRQMAEAHAQGDAAAVRSARSALLWGTLALAALGGLLLWLLREPVARLTLGPGSDPSTVGWIALAVALTVAAGSQTAYLTGLRRIGDLARLTVLSAIAGTIASIALLWFWGASALLALVLIGPALSVVLGHIFVARAAPIWDIERPGPALVPRWRELVRLGVPFMLTGVIVTAGFLAVRSMVQHDLGSVALGHYQAAWAISMTYIGFVLGAMGNDYYPRLVAVINDREAAVRLVNEQTEVALLLTGPAMVAMLGCAPWVIALLYTSEFGPSVEILRWQLLGDMFKVMSWPLGFILVAAGAGRTYVLTESIGMGVYVAVVGLGLAAIGLMSTGIAYLVMYLVYLPTVWWLAGRRIGFRWTRAVILQACGILLAALTVEAFARWSDLAGAIVGVSLGGILGVWALLRLAANSGATGRLAVVARIGLRMRLWIMDRL